MALLIDLLVTGQTRLNDDTYAKNIYADKFIRTGSSDSYVLLGGGGHKLLSDFSMSHSHPYLPLAGGEMSGSIIMNGNYIMGVSESGGGMIHFDGTRTVIGSIGASSTDSTHIRTKDAVLTVGSGNAASYTVLHTGNSSVSGGGSTWGSSITVKINGTSKTLTIPSNPNTDTLVQQSKTISSYFRPLLMGYTNTSVADATLETNVTNVSYVSLKFYAQPSTGKLYATEFVGNLSGTSTQTSKIYINNSSGYSTYPVLFTNLASAGTPRYDYVYVDSASGAGYNPSTNAFVASKMTAGTHNSTSTLYISSGTSSSIIFQIAGEEKARFLQPNGYFGIGITNPAYPLSVSGTIHTTTGFNANGKAVIDSTGRFSPTDTSYRNAGVYGVYDSHKVAHVWSMGTKYSIAADGSSTGNLYGLAYFHTNWSNSADYNKDGKTEVSEYAGGHQIAMIANGQVNASLGSYIWSRAGFIKYGSSNDYALMGGGGHKNIRNVQNTAFYKRIVTVNGSGYDMAGTTSSAAFTIYAPTAAGTSGQVLKSTGGTPTWINQSDIIAGSANNADILNIKSINSETDIVQSGIRGYEGSGSRWTGSIRSMGYAAIFSFGHPNRGWQLWAGRTGEVGNGLCWRRGIQAGTSWDSEMLILDSNNYTGYTVKKDGTGASGTWGISITGSAGSVAWGNVTGKPSTFTPSSHTHNYIVSLGDKNAADLSSTYPKGLSTNAIYKGNWPFNYGCGITAVDTHNGAFQIAGQWNHNVSSTTDNDKPTEMYIRGRRNLYDVWTTWSRVITDRNYTSYVNTTNFPGLNKVGTVTSVTVTGTNGLSGSGTITSSGTITLSNSGVRSVSINGNYLRVNTNGTNTDLTIPYATNADTVDGYHASHFATSGHTHSYLPLSGGTLTGGFGKSSNYIFKPNGADYRSKANTETGAICISLPASIGNTMFSMWIDVYNYSTNTSFSVHVGGYTYNSTFRYNPFAMVYGSSHKVRLTYSEGYKIYIGETTSTWTYPQISIRDILIGYNPTYTSWLSGWSISFVTTLPAINSEISRYVLSSDNYSTLVSPKTHDHTFASITSKPTTLSGYGITDGMYFFNDSANYLGARFLDATHAKKAAEKFIEFWQKNAGWFNFKAGKYMVNGATSSQFLKGDGSLDSNSYLTSINKSMVERVLTGKITTHSHYSLITEADNRNTNTTPNDYNNSIIFRGLKGNATIGCTSGSDYSYLIGLRGWSDSSGGNSHELAFNNGGIFRRQGATTNWGSWYKLLDSGNYNSYTPSLTGAGASGTWGISISGNAATATDADKLDGVHASGLFTALSNSGNNISITVGGTTKTLTVGYASNADTVDGYHHSDFVHTRSAIAGTDLNVYDINNSFIYDYIWTNAPTSNIIGSVIDLTYSPDWRYQIFCVPNSNNLIYTRARYSGTTWTNWKTIAFTDSDITGNAATATDADKLDGVHASGLFTALSNSGNNISVTIGGTNKTLTIGYATSAGSATSATKLQTARTIWGQSFNGTANISGSLSGVTNINASGNIYAAAFYENSDVRLKKDVSSIVSSVNIPVIKEFKWKQTNHKSYGLIAQDLEAMGYPELVYIKDDGYKSVNYTAAHSLIIGKLQLKIKELEDRIKYIESK